jgi:hypothetical protein
MADRPADRIARELGTPDIVDRLASLPPTDLQSLMLEVYAKLSARQTPKRVLEQHRTNRFARPADKDPRRFTDLDARAWSLLPKGFVPLELSPLAPLGASSALATVSQNKVVATSRNTEVMSDATNVLALEAALRRREGQALVQLVASHRVVRAQAPAEKHHRAHFRLLHLVSAGRGNEFELAQLKEHLDFHRCFLEPFGKVTIKLTDLGAGLSVPDVVPYPERPSGRGYYVRACFKIHLGDVEVGDGGFTEWTARLLSDTKERTLISAVATEHLAAR